MTPPPDPGSRRTATAGDSPYRLLGPGGPYDSDLPGTYGGHRRSKIYGTLDCPGALRHLKRGDTYAGSRVFFADVPTAVATGYRPCAVCLPEPYRLWRSTHPPGASTHPPGG